MRMSAATMALLLTGLDWTKFLSSVLLGLKNRAEPLKPLEIVRQSC